MRPGRPDRSAPRIATALLAAAALALALASCGGGSSPASAGAGTDAAATPTVKSRAELARERPRPPVPGVRCQAQVGGFLSAMEGLRKRLVAGLSYSQYISQLRAIRRAYDTIPAARVGLGCLRAAGTPGERGLNEYIAASNTWTDCVEVPGCASASIETQLQDQWRVASRYLSKAQDGLRRLGRE